MHHELSRRDFVKSTSLAATAAVALPTGFAMAAEPKTTLAWVGCAHIHTPGFINLLNRREDVRVNSVWDHDPQRARKRAKDLDAEVVPDLDSIWSDSDVAAVVICSETNRHLELVRAAARARKHMFVEKPLGITARDSYAMAQAIEKAGLLFTTGYFMRTDSKLLFLRDQIQQGNFGRITRVMGSTCHSGSLGGWFDEKPTDPANSWRWMADPLQAGVGAFGDLGTHSLDILMWLMGDVSSVSADIKVVTGRYGDCDESGQALIRFENGVTGSLTAGWVDVADPVTLQISGTEGHAIIFNGKLYFKSRHVEGANGNEPWEDLPASPPLPLAQFVQAVRGHENQPLVTPKEAADRVAVMEAMYRAARSNAWEKPTRA